MTPVRFPRVEQDRNAGNAGDWVKVPVGEAASVVAGLAGTTGVEVFDPFGGAGCYAASPDPVQALFRDDPYRRAMVRSLEAIVPHVTIDGSAPDFLGMGPMACRLCRPRLERYAGFDVDPDAAARLRVTMELLGLGARAAVGAGPTEGDGIANTPPLLARPAPEEGTWRLLLLDPMHWEDERFLRAGEGMIRQLAEGGGPDLVAVFNPATRSRGRWLDWKRAEDRLAGAVRSITGWREATFTLRKEAPSLGRAPQAGPAPHYRLTLLVNRDGVLGPVRRRWDERRGDPIARAWSDPS